MQTNNSKMNIFLKNVVVVTLLLIFASCAAITGKETTGEYIDDSAITAKVKTAILDEPTLSSYEIGVETFQRTVQLSGFVDTLKAKAKAKQVASKVKGVRKVQNDLVVRKNQE